MGKKKATEAVPALPTVPLEEQGARFLMAQQIIQDLHGQEARLSKRIEEIAVTKSKLDQLKDDAKSLDAKCQKLRMEAIDALEGRSTGRLPFGPGVPAEKTITVEELKTTPAALRECHYPNLLTRINAGEEPSVTKAITLEGRGDLRFILIDVGDVYRLLALHPNGWQSPSSQPELPGLTGKLVDFMDAKLVIGHAAESPLVEVELPDAPKKTGSGGLAEPGEARRGAAVDRARDAVTDSIDNLLDAMVAAGHLEATSDTALSEEQDLALVMAATGTANPRRWMKTASIDELGTLQQALAAFTVDQSKWPEIADRMKTAIGNGILPENPDDFAAPGDAGEGQGEAESNGDDADDAPTDEDAPESDEGRKSRPTGKRGGGKKSGAAKKAKKAGRGGKK